MELTISQISILRVQSGPIKNSLVAFSTLTVAEEDEAIDEIMFNFGEALLLMAREERNNQKENPGIFVGEFDYCALQFRERIFSFFLFIFLLCFALRLCSKLFKAFFMKNELLLHGYCLLY